MDLDHFLPMEILEAGKLEAQTLKILMNSTPQRNSLVLSPLVPSSTFTVMDAVYQFNQAPDLGLDAVCQFNQVLDLGLDAVFQITSAAAEQCQSGQR